MYKDAFQGHVFLSSSMSININSSLFLEIRFLTNIISVYQKDRKSMYLVAILIHTY